MRYLVRERIFSITNDFWVTDEQGSDVFLVDGKALSLRETFELKGVSGVTLATIHKRFLAFTDTMEIEHDGAVVATVHKAVFSPLRHRAIIDLADGRRLEAVGNSSTRTSRSSTAAGPSRVSPGRGSGFATPTASRSLQARTTP